MDLIACKAPGARAAEEGRRCYIKHEESVGAAEKEAVGADPYRGHRRVAGCAPYLGGEEEGPLHSEFVAAGEKLTAKRRLHAQVLSVKGLRGIKQNLEWLRLGDTGIFIWVRQGDTGILIWVSLGDTGIWISLHLRAIGFLWSRNVLSTEEKFLKCTMTAVMVQNQKNKKSKCTMTAR